MVDKKGMIARRVEALFVEVFRILGFGALVCFAIVGLFVYNFKVLENPLLESVLVSGLGVFFFVLFTFVTKDSDEGVRRG